jgi:hypothetical protein
VRVCVHARMRANMSICLMYCLADVESPSQNVTGYKVPTLESSCEVILGFFRSIQVNGTILPNVPCLLLAFYEPDKR